jgi:site-specific DNA-methyltransferase (adenine-specific)
MPNTLYYGDNLAILRGHVPDESVDLVYLDPPFNSKQDYNVLMEEQGGESCPARIEAFTDIWKWNERVYTDFREECPRPQLVDLVQGFVNTLGRNDVTAYLVMMAPRLVEIHRALRPTGSLYLHCDPTASHYLRVLLDVLFGKLSFRNEIVWSYKRYTAAGNRFQRLHDTILFYARGSKATFENLREDYGPRSGKADSHYRLDEDGRWYRWQKRRGQPPYKVYLSEGRRMGDVWEIPIINASARERLGYPTQKPVALLERIVEASSSPGDVVMDPFCGCGTAIAAAQEMGRRWIGIDVSHLAIALVKRRLADSFGLDEKLDYDVHGEAATASEARALTGG